MLQAKVRERELGLQSRQYAGSLSSSAAAICGLWHYFKCYAFLPLLGVSTCCYCMMEKNVKSAECFLFVDYVCVCVDRGIDSSKSTRTAALCLSPNGFAVG